MRAVQRHWKKRTPHTSLPGVCLLYPTRKTAGGGGAGSLGHLTPVHCRWDVKWCSRHGKQDGGSSKIKKKIELWPSRSTLGTDPKEDICTPTCTAASFITAQRWKQPKCPLVDVVYTCSGGLGWKGKDALTQATTRMNLGNVKLSDISQKQRDNYCMVILTEGAKSSHHW